MTPRAQKWGKRLLLGGGVLLFLCYLFCLPRELFRGVPCSTVVEDRSGELLGARIAADGQWRFPPRKAVPVRYALAVTTFEDRWFFYHPGVNPAALARALRDNIRSGHVTSGGSTLTMQLIRLSRGRERTLWQKGIEAVLATRLELRCSKAEILALYASYAPFGGNVVGIDAAAWRYFGRPPEQLSWGETATLAILPNAPSSLHPGKGREALLAKRNRLLERLRERGIIDAETCALACDEPLPDAPLPLPQWASHLVDRCAAEHRGEIVRSTIDLPLQRQVEAVLDRWNAEMARKGIEDLAAVVLDVATGEPLAYVGNAMPSRERPGARVDIARAPRSTGSILKPLLYCALLQEGQILPATLLPDVPININGFSPQNFDLQFYGGVPADRALARSLNVPAVHMLRRYGVPVFLDLLRRLGLTTLGRSASDYGLSLILGGAEGSLLDITSAYAGLSRAYQQRDGAAPLHDPLALWYTFRTLREVNRPDEIDLRLIRSVRPVAWKTGTSYGFRDAWAVGVTPRYAVGVWAGNARGQGVPDLTGARAAGPVLFDLFNLLPDPGWFEEPAPEEGVLMEVCTQSGQLKGIHCEEGELTLLPARAAASDPCPYHRMVDGQLRFLLPPSMEWYYRQHHPEYKPYVSVVGDRELPMEFIYPEAGSTLYLPRQLDGSVRGAVFNLAHRNPSTTVWWHLDQHYAGETRYLHQLTLNPEPGRHTLTVVDVQGHSLSISFTVGDPAA